MSRSGIIYLLHFDRPVGGKRHYIGFTRTKKVRLWEHSTGFGSKLATLAKNQGVGFQVAATWDLDVFLEQRLKRQKNAARLCPLCKKEELAS